MDKAIKERWNIDKVMKRLEEADFNPEFSGKFYKDILREFRGRGV